MQTGVDKSSGHPHWLSSTLYTFLAAYGCEGGQDGASYSDSSDQVMIKTRPINTLASTERLLKDVIDELGPIGGIFHLATVLRDCLFENQTVENFKQSAETKYWGSKYLDEATRRLCGDELKWCVRCVACSMNGGVGS
jgi:hypothetical protein